MKALDTEALTVVLKVNLVKIGAVHDFDDPSAIARASEGFCPFPRHYGDGDDEGTTEPVPVHIRPDGTVECRWGQEHGREATIFPLRVVQHRRGCF